MDAVQNSVEQQREQLIEEIRTLPADALKEAVEAIAQLRDEIAEREKAEQPSEQTSSSPYEAFKKSGLIGCIKDGPPDLSTNYKEYITEYLEEKHGYR